MEHIVVIFPRPDEYINMNQRGHWSKRAARTKTWRSAAWAAGNNMRRHPSFPPGFPEGKVRIQCDFPVRSLNIRRDPHNWAPTVKAIVDGLVTAKLIEDDDSDHVEILDSSFHDHSDNVYVNIYDCWWAR